MFFPCLENLKKARFPQQSIELLDWWLGTRRQNTIHNLNPLQFCLDCKLDFQHALKMFSHCVFDPDIALLDRKLTVICPNCSRDLQKADGKIDRNNLECCNCGTKVTDLLLPDCTLISFKLLKRPQELTENHPLDAIPIGASRGNVRSLRISELKQDSVVDDDIRRLYDSF